MLAKHRRGDEVLAEEVGDLHIYGEAQLLQRWGFAHLVLDGAVGAHVDVVRLEL